MGVVSQIEEGTTVFDAASDQRISLRSDCGGQGMCGKCRVSVHPVDHLSPVTESEASCLDPEQVAAGQRLACQARVQGPVAVTVPLEALESGNAVGKTEVRGTYPRDPAVERIFLPGASFSTREDVAARDLAERAASRTRRSCGKEIRWSDPVSLRDLSQPFACEGDVTLVHHEARGVTAVLKGKRLRSLGFAVDVGTTTIAVYLCDIGTGAVLASAGAANPQRRYGEDVISRIAFSNENDSNADTLRCLVVEEVNGLTRRCLEETGADHGDVDEMAVVGNTTMLELFGGLHPHGLGLSPYLPVTRLARDVRAGELGLTLNPGTNVHIFPVITGFVGGDTMGAILAERPHERGEISLIVDIGTNGELVLGNRDGLWVTSCATGPALEGAHINCGMRAVPGAIHRIAIDHGTLRVRPEVLGAPGELPKGVCGSGVIDAVASMRRSGILLPTGRMREDSPGVISDERGIGRRFVLVPAKDTATGREISIALEDVRQIQLAKAALGVGIRFLMRRAGVARIHRLVLTGAFGARFDWRNAVTIGMLPDASLFDRVEAVENAAGVGAIMALLDWNRREEACRLLDAVQAIELAEEPDFAMEFAMATAFPHLESEPGPG
jgi:uncharacterized 2Fe-2S/4Fe-4S cluster protein (DUF4445 family)